ncbi:hypothetical protein M3M33_16685, partial [Loigolactobacillus coryniformis]|uniref:hypothetical protein n=1 Tax=Loigolactobacillus coryniformis TaxID=1610 RepID=UPI00201A927C
LQALRSGQYLSGLGHAEGVLRLKANLAPELARVNVNPFVPVVSQCSAVACRQRVGHFVVSQPSVVGVDHLAQVV